MEEIIYRKNENEETARERVRIIPDEMASPQDFVEHSEYLTYREEDAFFFSKFKDPDMARELLREGKAVDRGDGFWVEGPSDQYGTFYLKYPSRKDARKSAKYDIELLASFLEGVWGFIYETKCPCCGEWKTKNSLWGIIGDKLEDYARDYLEEQKEEVARG